MSVLGLTGNETQEVVLFKDEKSGIEVSGTGIEARFPRTCDNPTPVATAK